MATALELRAATEGRPVATTLELRAVMEGCPVATALELCAVIEGVLWRRHWSCVLS